jgi:hypothetical protein
MSPPTVSNTKILKPIDFLKDTGNKFSPKTFNMEIDTHDSSKKRALWNIRELYSTRWRLSKKFLEELRKDKIFHPMAIRQDFIQSESDGVLYCHHALFVPLLKLLEALWGEKIAFAIEAEPAYYMPHCYRDDPRVREKKPVEDWTFWLLRTRGVEEPMYPILLYEAKAAGSILQNQHR